MSASSFYIDRKPRLLHEYDSFARYVHPTLARNFNPGDVDALVEETRQEYNRLIPQYLCPVDILYSESLDWGLTRTMTLAEGYPKCDFRFKNGA